MGFAVETERLRDGEKSEEEKGRNSINEQKSGGFKPQRGEIFVEK